METFIGIILGLIIVAAVLGLTTLAYNVIAGLISSFTQRLTGSTPPQRFNQRIG